LKNTIFELGALKIPMLLVPLSKKSSRGDQIENAKYFNRLGIAEVVEEENLESLEFVLEKMLSNLKPYKLSLAKSSFSNGTDSLLKVIFNATKSHA